MFKQTYIVALSLGAAACTGVGADARWSGAMTDSAGVSIVANTEVGIWSDAERWTLEEELRIGSLEGDDEYQFGQIGWLAVASDDRIFVLDAQAQHVKTFSPAGEYERTFGGPGAGPGELGRGAVFIVAAAGDTVIVADLANRRLNRYTSDGADAGSTPIALEQGLPLLFRATSTGMIAEQVRPLALPDRPAPDSLDTIVLLGSDGMPVDTLMRFPSGGTFNLGGRSPEIKLYSAEPSWALTDDGKLLFGTNDVYRINVHGISGELERVITLPYERKPVTERDKDAVYGFMERAARDAGAPPEAMIEIRRAVKFAEHFPAFTYLNGGPEGTIWVQHVQPASELTDEELQSYNLLEESGAPDWDVFDSEGRFLGTVTMPDRFAPRVFKGNKIYGVWRDDLDVQHVMRLKIVR